MHSVHAYQQRIVRPGRSFALTPVIVVDRDYQILAPQSTTAQEVPVSVVEEVKDPGAKADLHVSLGKTRMQSDGLS